MFDSRKMKSKIPVPLIHFITELSIGGAQMALLRLLTALDRNLFAPAVVCLYNGDGVIAKNIRALGVPVIDLGMTHKYRLDAFIRLYQMLRREHPAIIHTWMFHANLPGRVVGCLAGVPIIISSERTMGQEGRLRRVLNRGTVSLSDCVICVSQRVADYAAQTIELPQTKLFVIPNGVDLTDFASMPAQEQVRAAFRLPAQALIIGAIGRPRPVKGYGILLDAFSRVAAAHPNAHLVFVGQGPGRPALIAQANRLGFSTRLTFIDDQISIARILPALDLLALPSLWEGMPNVALEAMAASLPVVATTVGGTPEVVVDGETGLLVPPRDPDALAKAILHLLGDPGLRLRMGQAGRERVEKHFAISETVRKTEALYQKLLAEKGIVL